MTTLFKSWLHTYKVEALGFARYSLASGIRSLSHMQKLCSIHSGVIFLSQNLFFKLLSDSFAVRWCWCGQIPLWECCLSLHIVLRCISAVYLLVRLIPWWGRLSSYQLLLCSVFLICCVICLFQSDLSGFPELVQRSSPEAVLVIAGW